MLLFLKLLILLWLVNFAPPVIAVVFESKYDRPLDYGRLWRDGRPLLGRNKTLRGVLGAIIVAGLIGSILGFPLWLCLGVGVLSMLGDLFSSFLKRRLSFTSGDTVPGLDQIPEGLTPFCLIAPYYGLTLQYVLVFGVVFGIGAYVGSIFLYKVILKKPFEAYPRKIRALTRVRELVSCKITTKPFSQLLNFEDAVYYHVFMKTVFKTIGIYERGKRNALVVEKREVSFHFPDLPAAFDGYRILFLSDLHLDGLPGLTERAVEIIRRTPADMCILGGDLRMETYGPFTPALEQMGLLLPEIRVKEGIVGVLGNHDCPEIVEALKQLGVKFLLNGSLPLDRDGERIWVVGTDDCHYFKAHDLEAAFSGVPKGTFTIFVSHSSEVYKEALRYGPNLFLCGHTHGGQILLPRVGAVFTHSKAPRALCQGAWNYRGMPGYTSAGLGVSGVPVRFNSQGEVTVIVLRRGHEKVQVRAVEPG
jgi:predicted MPP superfamily phosphohydrolase